MMLDAKDLARFESKIWKSPDTGCWRWTCTINVYGYGHFYARGKLHRAHRVAYEHFIGPIAPGLQVDHLCRVRCCVNPDHLAAVTHRENQLAPGSLSNWSLSKSKTHCNHGHALVGHNLLPRKDEKRKCRACYNRIRMNWRHAKRPAGATP